MIKVKVIHVDIRDRCFVIS